MIPPPAAPKAPLESSPANETARPGLAGAVKAKQRLRLSSACYILFPIGTLSLQLSRNPSFFQGCLAFAAGIVLANSSLAVSAQTAAALRDRAANRRKTGLAPENALIRSGAALRLFSRLAKNEAHRIFHNGAAIAGAGLHFLAETLTRKSPSLNSFVIKAEPLIEAGIDRAERFELERHTLQGPTHCQRAFLSCLNEMERGEQAPNFDHLSVIWQASGLSGGALELGSEGKGSVAARLGALSARPPNLLANQARFEPAKLWSLAQTCKASEERELLSGAIGEARLADQPDTRPRHRL